MSEVPESLRHAKNRLEAANNELRDLTAKEFTPDTPNRMVRIQADLSLVIDDLSAAKASIES